MDIHYIQYLLTDTQSFKWMQFRGSAYIQIIKAHRHLWLIVENRRASQNFSNIPLLESLIEISWASIVKLNSAVINKAFFKQFKGNDICKYKLLILNLPMLQFNLIRNHLEFSNLIINRSGKMASTVVTIQQPSSDRDRASGCCLFWCPPCEVCAVEGKSIV